VEREIVGIMPWLKAFSNKRRFLALDNLTIDEFWNQYNLKKESIKNVA
jgi:hypothetical protein